MRLKEVGLTRGENLGYVALLIEGFEGTVRAFARTKRGDHIPAQVLWIDQLALRARLASENEKIYNAVCVIPLMDVDLTITVYDEANDMKSFEFGASVSKFKASFNMAFNKNIAANIKDFDAQKGLPYNHIEFIDVFEGIIRARVFTHEQATLEAYDLTGAKLDCEIKVLEDIVRVRRGLPMHEIVASLVFKDLPSGLLLVAKGVNGCFNVIKADRIKEMYDAWCKKTLNASIDPDYDSWLRQHRTSIMAFENTRRIVEDSWPHVAVVVLGCSGSTRTAYTNTVASLEQQVFRAVYVMRAGQYTFKVKAVAEQLDVDLVCFVRAGDILEPDALLKYVYGAMDHPEVSMWYSDTDTLSRRTYVDAMMKPRFSFEELAWGIGWEAGMCARMDVLKELNAKTDDAEMTVYELVLYAYRTGHAFEHIQRVQFHLRDVHHPKAEYEGRALARLLKSMDIMGEVQVRNNALRIAYDVSDAGKVSVIIVSHDDDEVQLRNCVKSIACGSSYPDFEVVVVAYRCRIDLENLLVGLDTCNVPVRVLEAPEDAGYCEATNYAVSHVDGDYVALLYDDLKVVNPDWIQEMLGPLMRKDVAITGAKLLYEDGLVEHAGMLCEPTGDVGYVNRNLSGAFQGYMQTLVRNVSYTVVSGACQMLKKSVFESLNGYDQTMNAGYSDVDLCLRAREAGYEVVLVNDAVLMHMLYTDKAKQADTRERRTKQFEDRHRCALSHSWAYANGDPYLNKHVEKDNEYFKLEW